jgi:hypothetical protein
LRGIFLNRLLSWSESLRERFTYETIFVPIETIDIESHDFCFIDSLIITCDLVGTAIIFCLSFSLSLEVRTVEIIFILAHRLHA